MSDQLALAFAQELASGLQSALGPDLVAAYLQGSAVAGGFVPGTSDIDLLVVVERDLDEVTAAALRTFHGSVVQRHAEWENRLELVYVGRGTLSDFRAGGLLGVISPGEPFHVRRGVELWIGNFYLVRETGVTVFGPPPADTIPPVSWAEFLTEIRRYADEVRSRDLRNATPGDRAYCVLTMCRALATVRDDRTYAKEEGAALVRSWMPEWAWLIDEASSCRLARGHAGFADERAIEAAVTFVALVGDAISEIARLGDAILRVTAVGANQLLGSAGGAAEGSSERSRAMTHHRQGRSVTKPVRMPIGAVILDMDGVVRHWRPGPTHAVDKTYGLPVGTINGIALTVPESYLGVLGVCSFADCSMPSPGSCRSTSGSKHARRYVVGRPTGATSTGTRWRSSSSSGPGCPSTSSPTPTTVSWTTCASSAYRRRSIAFTTPPR